MASTKFGVALLGSVTAAALMAAPVQADEIGDLKAQIEALSQKVQSMETQKAQPAAVPANVVTGGDFPGSYKLPGSTTSYAWGGYVKLDVIYDLAQKGGKESGAITEREDGAAQVDLDTGHFQMHARQTRFWFDGRTATEEQGVVRSYLELDFGGTDGTETLSNSHIPRLRQAFITMGPWLFGQAWSTYINLGAFTETIDFGGPVGGLLLRVPQVRYTMNFGPTQLNLAIENPHNVVSGGGTASGERDRMPDFVARVSHGGGWGHLSLAGAAQYYTAECGGPGGAACTDDTAWGFDGSLGGQFNLWGKDKLQWQVSGGDSDGRYILASANGGSFAVYDVANNKLDKVQYYAGYAGYQHHWTDKWRSNLVVGGAKHNNPGVAANTVTETQWSTHANLIWNATSKTNIGVEFIWIEHTAENGNDGVMNRIQGMVQHTF